MRSQGTVTYVLKLMNCDFDAFFKEVARGEGREPGSTQFNLFSHFHHFTAEPQRLPRF
jgi:hypothetical protein